MRNFANCSLFILVFQKFPSTKRILFVFSNCSTPSRARAPKRKPEIKNEVKDDDDDDDYIYDLEAGKLVKIETAPSTINKTGCEVVSPVIEEYIVERKRRSENDVGKLINNKRKRPDDTDDPIMEFFINMARTVKTFPTYWQAHAKNQVFLSVNLIEMKLLKSSASSDILDDAASTSTST